MNRITQLERELNEAQELIDRQGKGIIDAAHQLSIATNELQQAKQQILMDTECIERIRIAGEKAEAKLNDMKGEVEKAFREGVGSLCKDVEWEWQRSRARRVVEVEKV